MSQPARSRATGIALCLVVLASVPASIVHSQEQPPASTSPGRIVTDVRDVTITVSDLARSLAFYRTLGFESIGSSTLPPRAPLGPEFSMLPCSSGAIMSNVFGGAKVWTFLISRADFHPDRIRALRLQTGGKCVFCIRLRQKLFLAFGDCMILALSN